MSFEGRRSYRVEEILKVSLKNGVTKPSRVRGKGMKMVNMGELFGNPIIRNIAMERVPMNDKEVANYLLEYEDLLFARQSLTIEGAGKCSIFLGDDEPTTYEGHLIRLRVNKVYALPRFVYYYFTSSVGSNKISTIVTSTAAAGIRGSDLLNLQIELPNLKSQQKIVALLSSLDDKIELNRQTNQTLEAIAQALFKEWFVNFNFPGATGEMQDSELGEIPKGWRTSKLKEHIELNPKLSLKKDGVYNYVEMKDLSESSLSIRKPIERKFSSGSKFQHGDTLFARITPCLENGKTGFVDFLKDREVGWGSTEFIVLRGKGVSPYFVYCLARFNRFRDFAIKSMVGSSGRQRVVESILSDYTFTMPPLSLIDSFHQKLTSLFSLVKCNFEQTQTLTQLRDTLLPKLMRCEITIPESEQLIAAAI